MRTWRRYAFALAAFVGAGGFYLLRQWSVEQAAVRRQEACEELFRLLDQHKSEAGSYPSAQRLEKLAREGAWAASRVDNVLYFGDREKFWVEFEHPWLFDVHTHVYHSEDGYWSVSGS